MVVLRVAHKQAHPLSHRTGILLAMHFTPHTPAIQPCWHCTHFLALVYQASAARCSLGGIRAMPANGCAAWEREVGADDEPDLVPAAAAGFGQSGSSTMVKGTLAG